MSYATPIYDRTASDVQYVKSLNQRIANNGWSSLTQSERADWIAGLKGALNYTDLNRIEGNTEYIRDALEGYGYMMPSLTFISWSEATIPTTFTRIMSNLSEIATAWHSPSGTLPDAMSNYEDVNAIERYIAELKELITKMEQSFLYCGMIVCNGGRL